MVGNHKHLTDAEIQDYFKTGNEKRIIECQGCAECRDRIRRWALASGLFVNSKPHDPEDTGRVLEGLPDWMKE